MSGSPKYSTVRVAPAYAQREAERRRAQQEARRRREAERARQRAERARQRAERAARRAEQAADRRQRARAESERRENELAERRAADARADASRARQERAGADARRLAEVRALLEGVGGPDAEVRALGERVRELAERIDRAEPLGGAIEELRCRVVLLGQSRQAPGRGAGPASAADAEPAAVLAALEERLAAIGPEAGAHDPEGRRHCVELLGELRTVTDPGARTRTRFQALLGTVEHALTRHAATAAERATERRLGAERERAAERQAEQAARRREQEDRRRAAERAAAQERAQAAEQAERAAERERQAAERERHEAALAEAADRLGVVRGSAREAAAQARALADGELAERIEAAVRAVTEPLESGAAAAALTAVRALEELLPYAERQLDERELAGQRRMDLARALQDAMIGEGFAFTGGEEQGERLVLSFARPGGATYDTTVATDSGGTPVLVYHVDGEPDVRLHPEPEGAVCDSTADLLERVHEAIAEQDGFVPGELAWRGKPPGRRANPLPGAAERRRSR